MPLLDHRLVEFAMSLPSNLKIREGRGKWIFRRAISDLVPSGILNRPKRGFAIPLDRWFRHELRYRLDRILQKNSPVYEFLDFDAVSRVVDEHRRVRRDHSALLWRVLVLHIWLTAFSNR